jgi:hypothetical protein
MNLWDSYKLGVCWQMNNCQTLKGCLCTMESVTLCISLLFCFQREKILILIFWTVVISMSVGDRDSYLLFYLSYFYVFFLHYQILFASRAFLRYHLLTPIIVCNMKCVVYRNIFSVILGGFRMVKLTFFFRKGMCNGFIRRDLICWRKNPLLFIALFSFPHFPFYFFLPY